MAETVPTKAARAALRFFGVSLALSGLFLLGAAGLSAIEWRERARWEAVSFTITSVTSVQSDERPFPTIVTVNYSYRYRQLQLEGSTNELGKYSAEELEVFHEEGRSAEGRVDPDDPTRSTLQPAFIDAHLAATAILLGLGLSTLVMGWLLLRSSRIRSD